MPKMHSYFRSPEVLPYMRDCLQSCGTYLSLAGADVLKMRIADN